MQFLVESLLLASLITGAHSNVVRASDSSPATTHRSSIAVQRSVLDSRQQPQRWYGSPWVRAPLALIAGIASSNGEVFDTAVSNCRDFKNGWPMEKGGACIKGAIWTCWDIAAKAYTAYGTALAFLAQGPPLPDHGLKPRSDDSLLNSTQLEQFRAFLPSAYADHTFHGVFWGDKDVSRSLAFHTSDENAMYRHITNGSHGYVQTQRHQAGTKSKRGNNWAWNFGDKIAGIKLNYITPCSFTQRGEDKELYGLVGDFTTWALANPHDSYVMEFYDTNLNYDFMLASLIFEQTGFGTNYEGWNSKAYPPQHGCPQHTIFG